ncbi:MAG: hypothetical protein ACRC1H_09800, partial [Caldilineaceae bacterium]
MSRQPLSPSYPASRPTATGTLPPGGAMLQPLAPEQEPAPMPTATPWRRRLGETWRGLFAAQPWNGRLPPASATLAAQFWAEAAPWRITAGWSMLAALLTAGMLQDWGNLNWQTLLLLWLLVDPLWGALWRLAGGRPQLLALKAGPAGEALQLRLPYLREGSPAAQLVHLDEQNSIPYLVRVAAPTLLLTLLVAATLGLSALVGTVLLAIIAIGGWTMRRTLNLPPLLLHAVAVVLLPWMLVVVQWKIAPGSAQWTSTLLLALCWTLHAWGEGRAGLWQADQLAPWLMGLAQIGIVAVLVFNRVPIWVPLTAV